MPGRLARDGAYAERREEKKGECLSTYNRLVPCGLLVWPNSPVPVPVVDVVVVAGFPNRPPVFVVEEPKSPPVVGGCCWVVVEVPNRPPVCAGCDCCCCCCPVVVEPKRPPVCCGWLVVVWPNSPPVCWGCEDAVPNKEEPEEPPVWPGWDVAVPKSPPPAAGWLVLPLRETSQPCPRRREREREEDGRCRKPRLTRDWSSPC